MQVSLKMHAQNTSKHARPNEDILERLKGLLLNDLDVIERLTSILHETSYTAFKNNYNLFRISHAHEIQI